MPRLLQHHLRVPEAMAGLVLLLGVSTAQSAVHNLLRNGSFEGGIRYWYEADDKPLVKGDAANGEYALRIDKGGITSAAFLLRQGKPVTLSFSARSVEGDTTFGWQLTPCSREIGAKNNLTWSMRHFHPVTATAQWKRFSFTFTPTVAQDGFWPNPTYMLQLGDGDHPFLVDAVSVAEDAGADNYVPYRDIEVQTQCADLKGYQSPSGNLLEKDQTVSIQASAFNPGAHDREITLRWQLVDYEGSKTLSAPIERRLVVPAGKTISQAVPMKLTSSGLVLARTTVLDAGIPLDNSDLPLCSLPYPAHNTKADWAERFGGSIFGDHNLELLSKLGFGWTRWRPHMEWSDHQPNGADEWHWFDSDLDKLEQHGFSAHFVMFSKPSWAFDKPGDLLPKDMKWAVNDACWEQMTPICAWDRYVVASVAHYRGRSLIYEIENEPEFDWPDDQKALYARFTTRTARLIKQTNPDARVMVNNVYAIPSGINRHLLEQGAGKWIDVISWHDYHEGWLADAAAIRRMRAALDDLGCKHIEIWFNEGWAFTNTAVDEPAVALTHLNAAESTNAMVDSVSELTEAGQEKTILFHTGYDEHGMSFWDYAGPGTMLWDYYGYPTPLVPAWNTLAHHIGLSERVAYIRPAGATCCVFDDHRNHRGVVVAFANRDATADAVLKVPLDHLMAEDAMGNAAPVVDRTVTLLKSGRPVFIYSAENAPGAALAAAMEPLDQKNASVVGSGGKDFRLPLTWEGTTRHQADGNPIMSNGKAVWRLDQVWPDDPTIAGNYSPLAWNGAAWAPLQNGFGGQPEVKIENGAIDIAVRAPWTGTPGQRIAALIFEAPSAGVYHVTGSAKTQPWAGESKTYALALLKKDTQRAAEQKVWMLPRDGAAVAIDLDVDLEAGHELVFVPKMPDWHNATHTTIEHLRLERIGK